MAEFEWRMVEPPQDEIVLVSVCVFSCDDIRQENCTLHGVSTKFVATGYKHGIIWIVNGNIREDRDIIGWMPLPKPMDKYDLNYREWFKKKMETIRETLKAVSIERRNEE